MTRQLVLVLAGCALTSPVTSPGTPVPMTATTGTGTVDPCVSRQAIRSEAILAGWRAADGTTYAVGWSESLKIRAPDGRWTEEALPGAFGLDQLAGVEGGPLWATTWDDRVLRRSAPGTWSEVPVGAADLTGLTVLDADHIRLLARPQSTVDYEYYGPNEAQTELWAWDAGTWTMTLLPPTASSLSSLVVLPDGRSVMAGYDEVDVLTTANGLVPIPAPNGVSRVVAGPDGTLVAFGQTVAIGTVETGLVENRPPTPFYEFTAAWVGGPDDVIVTAVDWELGVIAHGAVWWWNGVVWTELLADAGGSFRSVYGPATDIVALGATDHEMAWSGDSAGLTLEREDWGVGSLAWGIVADRARGEAWGIGYERSVQHWDGTTWASVPLPGLAGSPDRIAADDGQVVVLAGEQAAVLDERGVTVTDLDEDVFFYAIAASEGSAFIFGTRRSDGSVEGLVDRGSGWAAIDLSTFPPDAEPHAAWADGPDDVWIGVERPATGGRQDRDSGGLVHWDGSTFSMVVDGLDSDIGWMERQSDGRLYFTQFSEAGAPDPSLFVIGDDGLPAPVAGIPFDVRSATLRDDGGWVISTIGRETGTEGEELYRAVLEGFAGQPFTELLRGDSGSGVAGHAGTVWSSDDDQTWTRTDCE